jgi:hypothetical protein
MTETKKGELHVTLASLVVGCLSALVLTPKELPNAGLLMAYPISFQPNELLVRSDQ